MASPYQKITVRLEPDVHVSHRPNHHVTILAGTTGKPAGEIVDVIVVVVGVLEEITSRQLDDNLFNPLILLTMVPLLQKVKIIPFPKHLAFSLSLL